VELRCSLCYKDQLVNAVQGNNRCENQARHTSALCGQDFEVSVHTATTGL
jgi:hypothetical protein